MRARAGVPRPAARDIRPPAGDALPRGLSGALWFEQVLCSSDNPGGMKRRDKEIRKQPSGDPSGGENPGILL